MKPPRDVRGASLPVSLRLLAYEAVRRRGSHVRITTQVHGERHEVIPRHRPIEVKTLSSILKSAARHHGMSIPRSDCLIGLFNGFGVAAEQPWGFSSFKAVGNPVYGLPL